MQPRIGSGFGNFSRVLGPWTDFFPSSAGLGLETSQFGVGIGTKIQAGALGATVTKLVIDPPFNIAGNNAGANWRLLIIEGDVDPSLFVQLSNKFQQATNGWPRLGASDLGVKVLFEKIIPNKTTVNNYGGIVTDTIVLDLGDNGPSIGSGQTMTVILLPLFNETGVPGYGAGNSTFLNISVFGKYEQIVGSPGQKDTQGRSIPRGMVGGI
jgi:hypothetical protein